MKQPPFIRLVLLLGLLVILANLLSCRTLNEDSISANGIDQVTFSEIDEDGDGRVSLIEMAVFKHAEGLAELDFDDDKKISRKEWAAAKPSAGENDPQFRLLDKNSDRFIDQEEAIAFITNHKAFASSFEEIDQNGDQFLVWEEYEAISPEALQVSLLQESDN